MTTYLTPSPPHGERARYLRGCRCTECSNANYRYTSRLRLDYQRGQRRRTSPDRAATRIHQLLNKGWSQTQISDASGVGRRGIGDIVQKARPSISRETERKILAMRPGPPPPPRDVEATGTVRRLRALIAVGHSSSSIATELGMHPDALGKIARHELPHVRTVTAQAVASIYTQLAETRGLSERARRHAATRNWAPPNAWDPDTIDNPDAHAEWTGRCGTDRGYHLHKIEHIPMCQPCEEAHQQWLADRQHLKGVELRSVITRARGQAAGRGAALAENARELLAQELSWEAISIRLGADPGQIAAAMRKYPDTSQQMEMAA
ncbi:hypothetical protein AB0F24_17660 [Streptomyces platensis]|uniref:hypothetical protein n=1 Tax=Streptomyces platensis TaxID=58346 RepID=UPI0033E4C0C0